MRNRSSVSLPTFVSVGLAKAPAGGASVRSNGVVRTVLGLMLASAASICAGAPALAAEPVSPERLAKAERMLSWNIMPKLVGGAPITPQWSHDGNSFWYRLETKSGATFQWVDPVRNTQTELVKRDRLVRALRLAGAPPVAVEHLPVTALVEPQGRDAWTAVVTVRGRQWRCTLAASYRCKPGGAAIGTGDALSPDGRWIAYLDKHNLFVRPAVGGPAVQLTRDGEEYYGVEGVGTYDHVSDRIAAERFGPSPPNIVWSPDSKRLSGWVVDNRTTRRLPIIQAAPPGTDAPRLSVIPRRWAGDADIGTGELRVFDVAGRTLWSSPKRTWWHTAPQDGGTRWTGPDRLTWLDPARGGRSVQLKTIDLTASAPRERVIFGEKADDNVHMCADYYCYGHNPNFRVIASGSKLLWWSERDGWGHIYLIDTASGRVERQITRGDWLVMDVVSVDEARGVLYFAGVGREPGIDPYLRQLYRVPLDGSSGPQRLTPEDAYHMGKPSRYDMATTISPSGDYFVDSFSRFDRAPETVLRRTDGSLVRVLAKADDTALRAAGWRPPEPFKVTAADGKTPLHGLIYRPSDFDPAKRYPVLIDYYPGPFTTHVRKVFGQRDTDEQPQATAEMGFIVVQLDARGTSYRSRAFRDVSYGTMGLGALEDYPSAIRQLGQRFPYMDLDRVGMYGLSSGGDMAFPLLAQNPALFKAAVVSGLSGKTYVTHEPEYGEGWLPLPVGNAAWNEAANTTWLPRIADDTLLILGTEMDDHANPAMTLQIVDELNKAGRRFSYEQLPNLNHVAQDLADPELKLSTTFFAHRWRFLAEKLGTPR